MKYFTACLIFLVIGVSSPAYSENVLYLTGSDWCPYICTDVKDSNKLAKNPGYLVEIIKYALNEYEIKYESPSWERAIKETREGTYDAIIGIYRSVAPELVYPARKLGFSEMCFYVEKGNPWIYKGITSLSEIRLGIIEGYFYDEGEVDQYISDFSQDAKRIEGIAGNRGLIQNLEKMLLRRITGVIDDHQVVQYTILANNLPDRFKQAGCLEGIDVQIGFSPAKKISKDNAQRISIAVDELRKNGSLHKILNKYGIKDWEK